MNGRDETCKNDSPENNRSSFNYKEQTHELQLINEILSESFQVEDIDSLCKLIGEAVHKLNKDCYVIVSLYDRNIDTIKTKAAIGFEDFTEKSVGISFRRLVEVSFKPKDMELPSQLLRSGKLEHFKGGLYALLAKKVPYDLCKIIEKKLDIGSILVIGFSYEEQIIGSISILIPNGKEVQNIFTIETIAAHASKQIQVIRTEKALSEAENKFEFLFEQAPLSYHSLDENGHFIDVNNTWLETLGYSYDEVIGKCFEDFLTAPYAKKFRENLEKFKTRGEAQGVEYEAVRKDGKIINIVVDGKIAYDEDGHFKQTHCVFKDITTQKEAERKALENEKLLFSMMDAITESALLTKTDGTIEYINETAAKRLGKTREELIGKTLFNNIHEEVLLNRKKMFDSVVNEGKTLKFEDIRSGIHFLHNIYPVYGPSNQLSHFAIFSMDITDYKGSMKKLKWELAVNKAIAELADALINPNNSIETIANIVLSTSQELTGSDHGYVSSVDPETGDNVCHTLTRMMENCCITDSEKRISFPRGPDGKYSKLIGHSLNTKRGFYTNYPEIHPGSGGAPGGHINLKNFLSIPAVVGNEIMGQISLANSKNGYSDREYEAVRKIAALYALALQQKRASMDIQYRDTLLKSILESTVDGIFVTDINHKIHFSNSKFARMLELTEDLNNMKSCGELVTYLFDKVKDPEEFSSKIKRLQFSNETDISYVHFKDGRVYERSSAPLVSNGTFKGRVWSLRDVTEKAEAEKALITAKIHAEEANRTKSEFLATMSHELRTPLNSVIGYSDILLAQMFGPLNEKQLKYLKNISTSGNHLLNLINDILDISRIESGDTSLSLEIVRISDIFEDVKNIAIPLAASKNIFLKFSVEPMDLNINSDKVKFKQILHNLVNNALKFTPVNGEVLVDAKKSGDIIEISVKDTGIGIPEDKQQMIFEPFKQVDSSLARMYKGTGLGLTIVKKLVEMHGGEIKLESEVDKGTTFIIMWPTTAIY